MPEELKDQAPTGDGGYPDTGPATGRTTDIGTPESYDGQADLGEDEPITDDGPADATDTFFDPKDLEGKPELQAAYKQMQSAFTKRMQELADQRHKIDAYDQFYQNPHEQVQRIASQLGLVLTPAQAAQAAQQVQNGQQSGENWEPQDWNDVLSRATNMAKQEIMKELSPVLSHVQSMQKKSIEQTLSEIDPGWMQYEDRMKTNLQQHPTLARDPGMLYRLSVPQEVLESRATQAALRKLEKRTQSAQISGTSTTHKQPSDMPKGKVTLQQAWDHAKKKLAGEGMTG